MNPFDNYLQNVIVRAQAEASDDGSATIEAPHLLLAIAAEPEPVTRRLLDSAGIDREAVRGALEREFEHSLSLVGVSRAAHDLPEPSRLSTRPSMGTTARLAMDRAFGSVARKKDLRPAHLLLGLISAEVGTVHRALVLAGVDLDDLKSRTRQALEDE